MFSRLKYIGKATNSDRLKLNCFTHRDRVTHICSVPYHYLNETDLLSIELLRTDFELNYNIRIAKYRRQNVGQFSVCSFSSPYAERFTVHIRLHTSCFTMPCSWAMHKVSHILCPTAFILCFYWSCYLLLAKIYNFGKYVRLTVSLSVCLCITRYRSQFLNNHH